MPNGSQTDVRQTVRCQSFRRLRCFGPACVRAQDAVSDSAVPLPPERRRQRVDHGTADGGSGLGQGQGKRQGLNALWVHSRVPKGRLRYGGLIHAGEGDTGQPLLPLRNRAFRQQSSLCRRQKDSSAFRSEEAAHELPTVLLRFSRCGPLEPFRKFVLACIRSEHMRSRASVVGNPAVSGGVT